MMATKRMSILGGCTGILLLALFGIVPLNASAMGIEAAVGGWRQDPSGDMGSMGDSLSIEDELNYDSKSRILGRVKIDMPSIIPNIYLMATPVKFEGEGVSTTNFKFGDKTFIANAPFSSDLRLHHYDIALYYGLPFLKKGTGGVFNIEIGFNARIFDIKEEIKQPITGTEWVSLTLPMPMLYLGAQLKPAKYFSLEVEARGVAYSSNHNYDLIGRVKIQPFGPVFIAGGYRYEKIKVDQSDVMVDMKIKGPFLELGFVF